MMNNKEIRLEEYFLTLINIKYVITPIKKLYIHRVGQIKLSRKFDPELFNIKIIRESIINKIKEDNFLLTNKINKPNIR